GGDEPAAPAEPEVVLTPKQRRQHKRSRHTGETRPQRSAEERQAERKETRAGKAKVRSAYRIKHRAKLKERRAAAPATEPTPVAETPAGKPKVRQGVVVSDKPDKTITVRIDVARRHRRYGKVVR